MKKSMYKVGIIGAGNIASGFDDIRTKSILTHAHAICSIDSLLLLGFYDNNLERGAEAARKWRTQYFNSLSELTADCDIICCATPDDSHYGILKAVIESKKDIKAIICEKPLSLDLSQAEEIVRECSRKKIPLIVNYTRRYIDAFRELREKIPSMGMLICGTCYYGKGVFHNGSHMINLMDFLIGLKKIDSIKIDKPVWDYSANDPSIGFVLELENGSRVFFHVISSKISTVFEFQLFFEKGKIVYDSTSEEIVIYSIKGMNKYDNYTCYTASNRVVVSRDEAIVNLYKETIDVINKNRNSRSSGDSTLLTLDICTTVLNGIEGRNE